MGASFAQSSVAAFWRTSFGCEEAVKVKDILYEHGDHIFEQGADVSCLGGFGAEMENLIFG